LIQDGNHVFCDLAFFQKHFEHMMFEEASQDFGILITICRCGTALMAFSHNHWQNSTTRF